MDTILITLSCIVAFLLINPFLAIKESNEVYYIGLNILLYIVYGCLFNVFNHINRYTDLTEMISILMSTTLMSLTSVLLILMIHVDFSKRVFFLVYIFSTFFIILSRLSWRLLIEKKIRHTTSKNIETNRIIVIGAGAGGRILLNAFDSEKNNGRVSLIGFVDDNPNKKNMYLSKVKVLGRVEDLPKLIKGNNVNMVTIAIPSLSKKRLREIVTLLEKSKVRVTTMPSLEEIVAGNITVEKLKQVEINDLLGRDEVKLDIDSIRDQITNKVILVTGAGGSIGSEICRQLVKFEPQRLILLGHGENSIYSIHRELSNKFKNYSCEIIPVIADVQDRKRIFEIVAQYHPNLVYHAAAHKHVPLMEYNPREAVKNNIYGTKNVAEASKKYNVDHFVMVSTDKANNPPNVMGATKRIAEMIVTSLNEADCTKFSAVRFGNVLGSRGSVIPLFKEQIANGGPVTVTDFRMTRFFMTIPEASRLVIQSGSLAKGGEIFILDMGEPVQILELAKNMIRLSGYSEDDISIIETGIRPGEKLYEELFYDPDHVGTTSSEKIYLSKFSPEKESLLPRVEKLLADSAGGTLSEAELKAAKEAREIRRQSSPGLSEEEQAVLIRESQYQKAEYKRKEKEWKKRLEELETEVNRFKTDIESLKTERKFCFLRRSEQSCGTKLFGRRSRLARLLFPRGIGCQ